MREKKLPSLYLIPTIVLTAFILFIAGVFLYLGFGYARVQEALSDKTKAPYEDYGITLPESFTRTFSYSSGAGFHGDKCTAAKYSINGDDTLFADFTEGSDAAAEQQMDFALKAAAVLENVRPDYAENYKWKLFENSDDLLVVIYFPDEGTVYFGEAIM